MIHVIQENQVSRRAMKYVLLTVAAVIYAISISLFLDPNNIAPGGITGVAILINRFVQIPTGTLNLILNIPIILLGLWKFGFTFIISTFYELFMITIFTNLLAPFEAVTDDLLMAAVLGGGLLAVALALTFKAGATTGGSDIIVKVLRLKWRHLKTGVIFMMTDFLVILASWIVFQDMTVAFYAGVAVIVDTIVMDLLLYGADEAKLIFIICKDISGMQERIIRELDITATIIHGEGAYTGECRKVLMVVSRKQMAPQIEEIVKEEDKSAFMIVTSATEIYGEGYKDIMKEKI